ncbi:transcription factor bHLH92-like isoform X2 [Dioscorea cayenensis subsp. rotundata]|uniref:Transcription factor bHLH92-like isoform X2 n=1 Tax=Dioscorea cayennensis subsp. rotundata TaxID=55577 RepID=A0AB40AV68_DIOCR|nr:transcription factor bHLH92-like isoform X2 [Dioscorea cayenensis subsp. rotundata]
MDSFWCQKEFLEGATLNYSFSPAPPINVVAGISENNSLIIAPTSAFKRYFRPLNIIQKCDHSPNVHQRVISFLKSIWKPNPKPKICEIDDVGSRDFRHMMRERHRREKLSQNYSELYSILAPMSKADKNSIVQSAAVYLKELLMIKEELHRQNKMLREKIIDTGNILQSKGLDSRTEHKMKDDNMSIEEAKIEVQLMNPVSTIDSMIEALQCMKGMGVKAMSIHSEFYGDEFTTMMTIYTKVEKSEERGVEGTPVEMERKMRLQLAITKKVSVDPNKAATTTTTSPCGQWRT